MSLDTRTVANFADHMMVAMKDSRTGEGFWFLFDDEAEWEWAKLNGSPLTTAVPAHEQVGALPREFREKLGLPVEADLAEWARSVPCGSAQRGADAGRPAGQSTP